MQPSTNAATLPEIEMVIRGTLACDYADEEIYGTGTYPAAYRIDNPLAWLFPDGLATGSLSEVEETTARTAVGLIVTNPPAPDSIRFYFNSDSFEAAWDSLKAALPGPVIRPLSQAS